MEAPSQQKEPTRSGNPDKKKAKEDGEAGLVTKKPGSKAQGRKRTKTGCLTCRRRRIKCGEERPTCQNCTKSKRVCEGYNQRVVFKDPLNTYRGPPIPSHVQFTEPVTPGRHGEPFQQSMSAGGPLPIAPKPPGSFVNSIMPPNVATHLPAATSPGIERKVYGFKTDAGPKPSKPTKEPTRSIRNPDITVDTVDHSRLPEPRTKKPPVDLATHYDFEALEPVNQDSKSPQSSTSTKTNPLEWSTGPNTSATFYRSYSNSSNWQTPTTSSTSGPSPLTVSTNNSILPSHLESASSSSGVSLKYEEGYPASSRQQRGPSTSIDNWNWDQPTTHMPEYALGDDDDDPYDPYDVSDGDENMADTNDDRIRPDDLHLLNNDLGVVVALQARQDTRSLAVRSITSYIDRPDMLSTYVPSPQTSPLQDPMSARIFCHFINVTGPTISMFERHPANPSLIFQGRPIPRSMQHNWTYTFPTLALQNPGLLHAMLALASLHIAKLQNGPITASLKHYAYSLRKIGKSVSLPHRRRHPATLAATLLLAFYECWCADHQKWTNHLLGAKMLVSEIDFDGITKYLRSVRLQQHREERAMDYQAQQQGYRPMYDQRLQHLGATEEVDENIVSMLMGKKLRYDQYGRIVEDSPPDDRRSKTYTERDIATYETQRDLFWWYCKNDAYQSILGGGRLFMDFDRWSHCPPRAPLGRLNATYGTFDHLILLMGRLSDFASKDVGRKRMAMKANGGYRPPGVSPPAQAQQEQAYQGPPQAQPQMPPFNGMMPGLGEARLPMGFDTARDQSPQSTQSIHSEDMDMDALRVEAEEEWQEIRNAFSVIEDHFGDDFQALGSEFSTPIQTPFGLARQYRTYGIAGIWLNYYMALITCHRAHPSMPPAAMIASGVAARHTETFANEIGRIAAGIAPDCTTTAEVSPGVGAALIESTIAMFIAGVQYQNAAQRHWTIDRLRNIARLTGWQTSHAICTGIETSWTKAAEVGRGPPYVRTSDDHHDRIIPDIWPTTRRLDLALMGSNSERRLVIRQSDRAHYALGILGLESDYETVDIVNDREA